MRSVLNGLEYLHKNNIVHRGKINKSKYTSFLTFKLDMKPENLLFKTPDPNAELVICDFG